MAKKVQPSAAYFEDYDDNTGDVVSGTRQSANIAAKFPKSSELGPFDFASDSGYSSRTATTGTSGQSRASGRPGPSPLTVNTATNSRSFQQQQQPSRPLATRVKESRKEKGKPKEDKRISAEMMHMERLRNANGMAVPSRSASKSQRRESVSLQHRPEMCWQCANGFHHGVNGVHSAPPMDPLSVNGYPGYYYSQAPPVQNVPPASPQAAQFYPYGPDVLIAHSSHRQRRASRSTAYHPDGNGRPVSYHGGGQESMYNTGPLPMNHYEQGPPSAYSSYYPQSSTPRQQYYAEPGSAFQAIYERSRSSMSRPKEHRRSSIYARPTVEHSPAKASYEDGSFLERHVSREQRPRRMSQSQRQPEPYDEAEAFYRGMPPPPPPQPKPKIIQKRQDLAPKQMGNGSMPPPTSRRMSHSRDSWDMSELKHALPNQQVRPIQAAPERSRSTRTRRTSYRESDPSREIAIENPRRRRAQYHEDEPSSRQLPTSDLEQKHRNAEEYQAAKSGRSSAAGVALTEDALRLKSKINQQRLDSDSGSQKTRSNSSRGSDARTRDGSGVGSRIEDDNSFTMTMHGMTIGFTQESVNGKRIHLRADDNGAIGLNIEGRRPRRYILPPGSDYTGVSSKKEIEDGRRAREERRSDRASRRSSRSTYSGRFD